MKLLQKLTDKVRNEVDGFPIIHRLEKNEWDKFSNLYVTWKVFNEYDPMELPELNKICHDTAQRHHKPKLDRFVNELHKKYGTNIKDYGIYRGCIVGRKK